MEPAAILVSLLGLAAAPEPGLVVALGNRGCVDVLARATAVLPPWPAEDVGASGERRDAPASGLPLTPGGQRILPSLRPCDRPLLESLEDVQAAVAHFLALGGAAERKCAPAVLAPLLARVPPTAARSLGGNAALMARKMAAAAGGGPSGLSVLLGARLGPQARELLGKGVECLGAEAAPGEERPGPEDEDEDDVHLVLEYNKGEAYGPAASAAAPRANRFIVTSAAVGDADVGGLLAAATAAWERKADVLVVSGLQIIESAPPPARKAALAAVGAALDRLQDGPAGSPAVHYEAASCASPGFVGELAAALLPRSDSLGFNEQEAADLYHALGGKYVGEADLPGSREEVASERASPRAVASLLRWLLESPEGQRLSRLHFHSLPFHLIAYRVPAGGGPLRLWRGGAGAVAAGSVAATAGALRAEPEAIAAEELQLLLRPAELSDPRQQPAATRLYSVDQASVVEWSWALAQGMGSVVFALAPVSVARRPLGTVGLGDAISAAALASDARAGVLAKS